MTTTQKIAIPLPCKQLWQQMKPTDNGRHCQHCSKTVVDFNGMSNKEIIDHLSAAKNACGRFDGNQLTALNRQLSMDNLQSAGLWKRAALIAGLVSQLSFFKAYSQIRQETIQQTIDTASKKPANNTIIGKVILPVPPVFRTISGTITDETDNCLPGAMVKISGFNLSVPTGQDGKFTIAVPSASTQFTVSFIGYRTQTIAIEPGKLDYQVKITEQQQMLLGEVVVSRQPFFKRFYYRFIRRPIRKIFDQLSISAKTPSFKE